MVSSVGLSNANVSFNAIPQGVQSNGYYQTPVSFEGRQADTVELSGKKKSSTAKKGIIAAAAGAAVVAAGLYIGVKSGKLTKVEDATKLTDKLKNVAYNGGSLVKKGVDFVTGKGKEIIGKITKKGTEETANIDLEDIESISNSINSDPISIGQRKTAGISRENFDNVIKQQSNPYHFEVPSFRKMCEDHGVRFKTNA